MKKNLKRIVVSDLDETLLGKPKTLKELKSALKEPGTKVGVLSNRPKFLIKAALKRMGLKPDFAISAFLDEKSKYLKKIKQKYPNLAKYIYIGNTESGRKEAKKAGFTFKWGECFEKGPCSL